MEKNMVELYQLVEGEIPDGKRVLADSYANLKKVADYCEGNYLQAEDKRAALDETRGYTTQALASIAYQINTLATNFMHLVDLQTGQLADIESSVHHLSQTVTIHKEKVARREIGILTTNRSYFRPPGVKAPGIIYPEQPEKPVKYVRKSIDFSILDDIGHGVKTATVPQSQPRTLPRTNSVASSVGVGSGGSISRGSLAGLQAPGMQPPVPPQLQHQTSVAQPSASGANIGTIGRSQYRTAGYLVAAAAPVTPPTVPSHYMSTQQLMQAQQQQQQAAAQQPAQSSTRSVYAPVPQAMAAPPPPPPSSAMTSAQNLPASLVNGESMAAGGGASAGTYAASRMSVMPPPPPPSQLVAGGGQQLLPPPPPSPQVTHYSQLPINLMGSGMAVPAEGYTFSEDFMPLPPPLSANDVQRSDSHIGHAFYSRENSMSSSMLPPPPPLSSTDYDGEGNGGMNAAHGHTTGASGGDNSWIPANYIEKVIAIYDYEQDKDDELTFQENTVIYVVKHNDDGWWEGVMAPGVRGLFPHNYVESCI